MADHKLKDVLGSRNKFCSHSSSRSLAMKEKHIACLEILAQHLQKHLRLYEDCVSMENLIKGIGEYKME